MRFENKRWSIALDAVDHRFVLLVSPLPVRFGFSVPFFFDLFKRFPGGVRAENRSDDHADCRKSDEENRCGLHSMSFNDDRHEIAPDSEANSRCKEKKSLRGRPIPCREKFATPYLVKRLLTGTVVNTDEYSNQNENVHSHDCFREKKASPTSDKKAGDDEIDQTTAVSIRQSHKNEQRGKARSHKKKNAEHLCGNAFDTTCRFINVRQKKAHCACREIPDGVNAEQKENTFQIWTGKQIAHFRLAPNALGDQFLFLLFAGDPVFGFRHTQTHDPGEKRDNDQMGKDEPITEQAEFKIVHDYGKDQHDCRAERPHDLCRSAMSCPIFSWSIFRNQRPRRYHIRSDRQTDDDIPDKKHRVIDTENDQEHPEHVEEQIIGVNEFASVTIADVSSNYRTDGCGQGIGTARSKESILPGCHTEIFFPKGQPGTTGDNGAGINITGEGSDNCFLPR